MKYKNFILRTLDLLLILGVLWLYQSVALTRADAVAARQKEIADAESWNASVLQAQAEQETAAESGYRDGTYEGSAFGFGDEITVSVTIADGKLTDISVGPRSACPSGPCGTGSGSNTPCWPSSPGCARPGSTTKPPAPARGRSFPG